LQNHFTKSDGWKASRRSATVVALMTAAERSKNEGRRTFQFRAIAAGVRQRDFATALKLVDEADQADPIS